MAFTTFARAVAFLAVAAAPAAAFAPSSFGVPKVGPSRSFACRFRVVDRLGEGTAYLLSTGWTYNSIHPV